MQVSSLRWSSGAWMSLCDASRWKCGGVGGVGGEKQEEEEREAGGEDVVYLRGSATMPI